MKPLFEQLTAPFSRLYGLTFRFHDYSKNALKDVTSFESCYHSYHLCAKVKRDGYLKECIQFDGNTVQYKLLRYSQPFFKCCHAGIIEHVTPLKKMGVIVGVMFTGLFYWQDAASFPETFLTALPTKQIDHKELQNLIPLTNKTVNDYQAICTTIACQLQSVLSEQSRTNVDDIDIKWRIEAFLQSNFSAQLSLKDLATHIWLSESRTSHILKHYFNRTFPELLNTFRLNQAKNLLTYTELSVKEVASLSGYTDPGYFHRVFKKSEGASPLNYRKLYRSEKTKAHDI